MTGILKTCTKRNSHIKRIFVWVFAVGLIFVLYDTPPRKTQAESFNKKGTTETVHVAQTETKQVSKVATPQPKVEEQAPAPKPVPKPQPVQGVTNCGDNPYKQYIYQKESGCRTNAINTNGGACGIGQALPCSKLPCTLSDFACQDAWFSNYAITRYGSWQNAYSFWVKNHWW